MSEELRKAAERMLHTTACALGIFNVKRKPSQELRSWWQRLIAWCRR